MPRGRRRVEDPATARRILAAAESHFAARGLAGARTEEIATAAHANKAMLYYYFGDKRRLHRAVLENLMRQLRSSVFAPPKKKLPPRERFFGYVSGYFDFLAAHPNYPRLVQRQAMESRPEFEGLVKDLFRPLHREFAQTIEEGIVQGEFRAVDTEQVAMMAMQMATGYFAAAAVMGRVAGRDLLAPEAIAARKRALLDFLEHGLAPEGDKAR